MQQMVPYLKGEKHPMGARIVDSQPSLRTEDIEEVGDNRHTCMFEMLGNWSLGDYFKSEQLPWIWEFFTSVLKLDKDRLYVTLFEGNELVEKDLESLAIWKKIGVADDHIFFYPGKKNWWSRAGTPDQMPVGEIGGPTSEIFYIFPNVVHDVKYGAECHPNCDCGRFIEIGNSVFMAYEKIEGGLRPLPAQNVDFGGGFERIVAAVQDTPDVFKTDLFAPIIKTIEEYTGKSYIGNETPMRIIADHLRAATFMIAEGIEPSNKMQGYVLRRLLRRAAVKDRQLGGSITSSPFLSAVAEETLRFYSEAGYFDFVKVKDRVDRTINTEMEKFARALDRGLKEMDKVSVDELTPQFAFHLFQSYGFPYEVTEELAQKKGVVLDKAEYDRIFSKHKEGSRTASAGMFKGGLSDHSEVTTKLHTATHLLHKALRTVLGDTVHQAGSNITPERLRFDYTYAGKPTAEQLAEIEQIINAAIAADYPVTRRIEDKEEAIKSGAMAFFAEKYPDKVSVYIIGKDHDNGWFSKELCGGPHVEHTGLIGQVTLLKDESLGSGTRRLYAKLA